jgi:hypothetical protein
LTTVSVRFFAVQDLVQVGGAAAGRPLGLAFAWVGVAIKEQSKKRSLPIKKGGKTCNLRLLFAKNISRL